MVELEVKEGILVVKIMPTKSDEDVDVGTMKTTKQK